MIHLVRHYLLKSQILCIACSLAILFFIYIRIWAITFFDAARFRQVIEFFKDFEKFSAGDSIVSAGPVVCEELV